MENNECNTITIIDESGESKVERVEYIKDSGLIVEGMFAILKQPLILKGAVYQHLFVGDALLISQLKFADGNLHTVVLRDHPRNCSIVNAFSFSYLFDEFLEKFDVISQKDGESIRAKEVALINAQVDVENQAMDEFRNNPNKLNQICFDIYSRRLNSPEIKQPVNLTGNIAGLLGSANALDHIEALNSQVNMAQDLIEIRAKYLAERMDSLNKLVSSIQPYVRERHLGIIASTNEVTESAAKMNDGLESLNLYSLKGVSVSTVKEGKGADSSIPLTLVQKRMNADVELAFFREKESEHLDVNKAHIFFDELRDNQTLVEQIFPTERCVLVMALRSTDIDYKDPFFAMRMNDLNREAFLMIRNGENIHVVYSPISTHLATQNLFPGKDHIEKYFTKANGEINVTIDSLNYSEVLNAIDKTTLHYKRFLILLAGLQHNQQLLGDFYPLEESFGIFHPEFQDKYFNFIFDDTGEGLIVTQKLKPLLEWLKDKNSVLRKGSTVICNTKEMVASYTAPACYRYVYQPSRDDNYRAIKWPVEKTVITNVQQDKDGFFVKIAVSNERGYSDRLSEVNARVWIMEDNQSENGKLQYLVLDALTLEELDAYIADRNSRADYNKYVHLFKLAKAYLIEQKNTNPQFNYYMDAIEHIQDKNDVSSVEVEILVRDSINFLSGAKQQVVLGYLNSILSKSAQSKLLEQLSNLFSGEGESLVCVRIDSKGKKFVYTTMHESLRLDMLGKHVWLYRTEIGLKSGKYHCIADKQICTLMNHHRDERMIKVLDEAIYREYAAIPYEKQTQLSVYGSRVELSTGLKFSTYSEKRAMVDMLNFGKESLEKIFTNAVDRELVERLICGMNESGLKQSNHKHELAFPVYIGGSYSSVLRIAIKNSVEWVEGLYKQYLAQPNVDLIEQDNSGLVFGGCFNSNCFDFTYKSLWLSESLFRFAYHLDSTRSLSYLLNWVKRENRGLSSSEDGFSYSPYAVDIGKLTIEYDYSFGNKIFNSAVVDIRYMTLYRHLSEVGTFKTVSNERSYFIGELKDIETLKLQLEAENQEFISGVDIRKHSATAGVRISDDCVITLSDDDFGYIVSRALYQMDYGERDGEFYLNGKTNCHEYKRGQFDS